MRGIKCRICGYENDPGELRNGICFDCQLNGVKQRNIKEQMDNMVRSTDYKQLSMEEIINENHKNQN